MTSFRTALPPANQPPLFHVDSTRARTTSSKTTRRIEDSGPRAHDRRDVFNARLLSGVTLVGPYDIPRIEPCALVPKALVAFSDAMAKATRDADAWIHFYEDDYRFMRLWHAPEKYFDRLRSFAGVIAPDFSVYRNMPVAQQIEHTYRNQLLGARMQTDGFNVIANVRVSGRSSVPYSLAGTPCHSTIALGLHGCTRDRTNRRHVQEEIRIICDELSPARIVVYGSAAYGVLDYPRELGVPVHVFSPDTFTRSRTKKAVA